jgi:hypothetical protein
MLASILSIVHVELHQYLCLCFVAAGHYVYAKSAYVYLSMMFKLELDHPEAYRHFKAGHHVLRRTDRFLGGLWTDLTIEQILMRSVKSSGGLTHKYAVKHRFFQISIQRL